MKIIYNKKVDKYLQKQQKGDPRGIDKVKQFLEFYLQPAENPTALKNAKKMQGNYQKYANIWRWRVGDYRIRGDVKNKVLEIQLIEISTLGGFV